MTKNPNQGFFVCVVGGGGHGGWVWGFNSHFK